MSQVGTKSSKPATVDEYVDVQSGEVLEILVELRALVRSTLPRAEERLKWGVPTYFRGADEPFCYLYAGRDHVNLGFVHGARLADPKGLLQGKREQGRHVTVFAAEEIQKTAFRALLRAAYRAAHG